MRSALRLISLVLISLALMLLGADLVTSLDMGGEITVRSVEQVWRLFSVNGVAHFRDWALHHWPPFALHAFDVVLTLPGWAVTGVPGVILNFLAGRAPDGE
ncbi:MAG: hypothetical protein WDM89_12285 [Rhizomicrobium sp.]